MQHRWKILAPIDLGSDADTRVQTAIQVAEAVQGDVTLLYVIDPARSKRVERVEWPASAMTEHPTCAVRRVVLVGPVAKTVSRYADDLGADVVSVTRGSYNLWKRLTRRSAAGPIASATDRPVCFARRSAEMPPSRFRAILTVVELNGTDDPVVRFSEELAKRCNATLLLFHVVPEASEALLAHGIPGAEDRPLSAEVAEQRIRDLTAGMSCPHLSSIVTGSAYRAIADAVKEHKTDVIVTGRRNPESASGLSVATVLSQAPCPVVSVPVGSHARIQSGVEQRHLYTTGAY